jgi:hypothetical protein
MFPHHLAPPSKSKSKASVRNFCATFCFMLLPLRCALGFTALLVRRWSRDIVARAKKHVHGAGDGGEHRGFHCIFCMRNFAASTYNPMECIDTAMLRQCAVWELVVLTTSSRLRAGPHNFFRFQNLEHLELPLIARGSIIRFPPSISSLTPAICSHGLDTALKLDGRGMLGMGRALFAGHIFHSIDFSTRQTTWQCKNCTLNPQ